MYSSYWFVFVGHRLQTTREYIKKAWNLTIAYSLIRGSGIPFRKNKHITPTPNMKCHQTEQSRRMLCGGIYISQRAFTAFLFWARVKFTRFLITKTSANKRFYNMSAKSIAQLCAAKLQQFFELCKCWSVKCSV